MIKWDIQIGRGERADTYKEWGLIPLSIDSRLSSSVKKQDSTAYAEEAGEHVDTRAVYDAFDVVARFAAVADRGGRVNTLIKSFNDAIMVKRGGSDVYDKQVVALYDHYKHRVLVGYPEPIGEEPEEWFQVGREEVAIVELRIRVSNPNDCDFDYSEARGIGYDIIGTNLKIGD